MACKFDIGPYIMTCQGDFIILVRIPSNEGLYLLNSFLLRDGRFSVTVEVNLINSQCGISCFQFPVIYKYFLCLNNLPFSRSTKPTESNE